MNPITAQQLQNHVEKLASEDKPDRLDYLSFARVTNGGVDGKSRTISRIDRLSFGRIKEEVSWINSKEAAALAQFSGLPARRHFSASDISTWV